MPQDDKLHIHIDSSELREGILDHQVDVCPTCKSLLVESYGLAGGGFGIYGFCDSCERIVWKCVTEE